MRRTPQKRDVRYSLKSRIDKSSTHSDLSIFDTALSNDLRKRNPIPMLILKMAFNGNN